MGILGKQNWVHQHWIFPLLCYLWGKESSCSLIESFGGYFCKKKKKCYVCILAWKFFHLSLKLGEQHTEQEAESAGFSVPLSTGRNMP